MCQKGIPWALACKRSEIHNSSRITCFTLLQTVFDESWPTAKQHGLKEAQDNAAKRTIRRMEEKVSEVS